VTTEILEGKNWKVLPNGNIVSGTAMYGLQLATIDNNVFSFGGFIKPNAGDISSILKFNIDERKWQNTTYHMSRPRYFHAVSVVDFKYYSKACLE